MKQAPIILFDEATSSLDIQTEQAVKEAMKAASLNKTAFIIAHRLTTVKDCDLIIVLEEGQIVETGDHESLIADEESLYFKMWSNYS